MVPVSSVASSRSSGPTGSPRMKSWRPAVAVALDLDVERLRQRVDHRDADAVQPAGDLVAAAAELAAGMQHGQRQGDGRDLLVRMLLDRDAAAVVDHLDAALGQQPDQDGVAVAGQRLVDGVVDHLVHQVVQAALAGGADVHAGPLADGLQALEHGDRLGVVAAGVTAEERILSRSPAAAASSSSVMLMSSGRWSSGVSLVGRGRHRLGLLSQVRRPHLILETRMKQAARLS